MIAGRRFRPRAWSIVATLAAASLCVALGLWQIERAAYKQSVEDRFARRLAADYDDYVAGDETDDLQFRKLVFSGRYDAERNFLLDNQVYRGRAGYHVLTPLHLDGSDRILLVNRGWAEWGPRREPMPAIPAPAQSGGARGIVFYPSEPALDLGGARLAGEWPQLISYIDIDGLQAQYSERLLPFVLWLAPEQPGHLVRDWDPVWLPAAKSRAYAVQWFSFAAIVVVLFVVLNLKKVE